MDEPDVESQRHPSSGDTGAQRQLSTADDNDAVTVGGALDFDRP
ncbi:hypothetical protein [Mycolicibacterium parafortuitum]|uniref:Uncharacterized protein n=1 Tax=Mycolicibacterium parafortuitum TaxID=39692 RepID=A0ACC6MPU9_MYCPF|nr:MULTISPECIES: hypothetical protein [Mycobacteriaceae]MDZ5089042.1 hypothetical protein [Mycolicibacterium parafortuitum]